MYWVCLRIYLWYPHCAKCEYTQSVVLCVHTMMTRDASKMIFMYIHTHTLRIPCERATLDNCFALQSARPVFPRSPKLVNQMPTEIGFLSFFNWILSSAAVQTIAVWTPFENPATCSVAPSDMWKSDSLHIYWGVPYAYKSIKCLCTNTHRTHICA